MRHPALFAVLLTFSATCIAATCGAQQANPPKRESASGDSDSSSRAPMTPRQIAEMHAQILMARKDYAEAAIAYQQLLESDPRNPDLLTTTGMAYEQLGNYELAEHFYKSAIKTDKNFSHALNNLGTLEYSKKRYKQAISYYKKALVSGKDMAPIYTNLGYAYCSIKQYPLAMTAFSRAIAIDPTVLDQRGAGGTLGQQRTAADPGALNFFLAKSYAKAGDAEHAARYLKLARDEGYKNFRLVEKDPDFIPVIKDARVQEVLRAQPGYATAPAPQKPVD